MTDDFFDELQDLNEDKKFEEENLGKLGDYCVMLEDKAGEIAKIKENLKKQEGLYRIWSMDIIPDLMGQLGLTELKLKSGRKITLKDDFTIKVIAASAPQFLDWMIKRGFQAIIKNKVEVMFPKEGRKSSKNFVKYIKRYYKDKCSMNEQETIHPQTLKAWARGQRESGGNLPDRFLNIFSFTIAKLK